MWTNTAFLKFDSEEDWRSHALTLGILQVVTNEETGESTDVWNYYTKDWAIDVVGIIYEPGTYDEEGNELTAPVAHDGYHVNAKWNVSLPASVSTRSVMPMTPRRIFYGDNLEEIKSRSIAARSE